MDKLKLRKEILSGIEPPRIPANTVWAEQYGIRPNGAVLQTEPLQYAIDALSSAGGGRLMLPAGVYRTGALRLRSGVELHLAEAETLIQFVQSEQEKAHPVVYSHWEATPCYNYSALLYACDACDVAVTGRGTLDGGANREHWWNWHHQMESSWAENRPNLQQKDSDALRDMNARGVPVKQRVFGAGHYLRPNFVQLIRCQRVLLQGVTLKNSPMWQLNPVMCRGVTVNGVTFSSHGPNNDGCDPESCRGVWIKDCRFDTGDDCISLKSGRDRDGRTANIPCQDVLIENNDFADGHGGVALGSEMSGGIRNVLACGNRFASPNLTYALRLKTNAKRGGYVENIVLCDSKIDTVSGAAVHGTMLYEDGRNGDALPEFRNITIENITAHGGDYGIFLEAFPETPVTGLVLRNIAIDGAARELRSMNWQNAVVENVTINGKRFPRPERVRILDVPSPGLTVSASAVRCAGRPEMTFSWQYRTEQKEWLDGGKGAAFRVPETAQQLRVRAVDEDGNTEGSRVYGVVLPEIAAEDRVLARLACRGMLPGGLLRSVREVPDVPVTCAELARMLWPLTRHGAEAAAPPSRSGAALEQAVANGFFPPQKGKIDAEGTMSREEMATVAMQACGVSYRNASTTTPCCRDAAEVSANYGTNVARALYFGFMTQNDGYFEPKRAVTRREAAETLNRVADFFGA